MSLKHVILSLPSVQIDSTMEMLLKSLFSPTFICTALFLLKSLMSPVDDILPSAFPALIKAWMGDRSEFYFLMNNIYVDGWNNRFISM